MAKQEDLFKNLTAHCKEYGFIFQSSEIYDGLSAVYDYAQLGIELKNNIKSYWWKSMVQFNENIVGIDSSIFMHPKVWKASGHLEAFNDPLIDNKDSKKRYRADVLIEDYVAKIEAKIDKEIKKAAKRFGDSFDELQYRTTNERVMRYQSEIDSILHRMNEALNKNDLVALRDLIIDLDIPCPISGTRNWTDVRQFNLMFSTQMGSTSEDSSTIYLRPETAQGIFVNFKNILRTSRRKLPLGVCNIGKSFRNEITPGNFIFRTREFEQAELEFFCQPGTDEEWFSYWKTFCLNFLKSLNLKEENLRYRDHSANELSFYSKETTDIEYYFPFGWGELLGIANRTDYDLKRHSEFSGENFDYLDPETKETYIPYCVEPSFGVDRLMLALMCDAFLEETLEKDTRLVMKLHPALAPYKVAILPLSKQLNEKALEIVHILNKHFQVTYDESGSIGRRYRRQDAIGTPFAVTIDFETSSDQSVTIRERDSMKQIRLPITEIVNYLKVKLFY